MTEILMFDIRELADTNLYHKVCEELPDVGLWKERSKKMSAYRFQEDRLRCIGGTLLIKYIFEAFSTDYGSLNISPYGKYIVEQSGFYFNISHSGDYVVIAFGDTSCGIDIEQITDAGKIAGKFFCKSEAEQCTDPESFTRLWTLKEAYIKEVGEGLRIPLDSFEVVPGRILHIGEELTAVTASPLTRVRNDEERQFSEFRLKSYCISVCSKSEISSRIERISLNKLLNS